MPAADAGPILLPQGGFNQSRTYLSDWVGVYAFIFGSLVERYDDIDVGDYAELTQTFDFTSVDAVTFTIGIKSASDGNWLFEVLVAGTVLFSLSITYALFTSATTYLSRAINTKSFAGSQTLKFRLTAQ